MKNVISLKGLPPGEYDLTIILHDEIAKGPPATRSSSFESSPPRSPKQEKTNRRRTSSRLSTKHIVVLPAVGRLQASGLTGWPARVSSSKGKRRVLPTQVGRDRLSRAWAAFR